MYRTARRTVAAWTCALLGVLDARAPGAREDSGALACLEALRARLHHGDRGSGVEAHDDLLAVLLGGAMLDGVAGETAADRAEDGSHRAAGPARERAAEQAADRRARHGTDGRVILAEPRGAHALDGPVGDAFRDARLAVAVVLRPVARAARGNRQRRSGKHGERECLSHLKSLFRLVARCPMHTRYCGAGA